jgi:hypothetical protein
MEILNLTREELFDLVWSTPMSKLAKRFSISDVALAKTCKKLNVPTPARGYWAQIAAGAKPTRPQLPKVAPGAQQNVRLGLAPEEGTAARPVVPDVKVPERLANPHPAVVWLVQAL